VDEKKLLVEAHRRLGEETAIEVQYLDSLQKTKSGKLRFVISDIPESKV
jgi:phenylacetate-CoA ligase